MITPSSLRFLSAAFAAALAASSASAALLISEDFDYTVGGLSTNNGGTGFGGAYGAVGAVNNVAVVTPGLSVGITGYSVVGAGNAISNSTTSTFAAREFGSSLSMTDGTSYYFSMLINVAALNAQSRGIRLFNSAGTSNTGFGVNVGTAGLIAGINNNTGTTFNDLAIVTGTTQLLVGKVTFSDTAGQDRLDVWLFNSGADITAVSFASSTTFVTGTVTATNGVSFGRGTVANDYKLDTFRLGTTADSVLTAVPEPSSFAALAGLGALGFAASRRRRRA